MYPAAEIKTGQKISQPSRAPWEPQFSMSAFFQSHTFGTALLADENG
jgi:hypothetical protein